MPRPALRKIKRPQENPQATSTPLRGQQRHVLEGSDVEERQERRAQGSPEVGRRVAPMTPPLQQYDDTGAKDKDDDSPLSSLPSSDGSCAEEDPPRAPLRVMQPMDTNTLISLLPRRRTCHEDILAEESDEEAPKRSKRRAKTRHATHHKEQPPNHAQSESESNNKQENRLAIQEKFKEIDEWQLDTEEITISTTSSF